VVLGFELRAYTLSHYTSPFLLSFFLRQGLTNYLPRLALNHDPPGLCLLSSYRMTGVSHQRLTTEQIFHRLGKQGQAQC
jgi:hypothetical protein